MKTRSHARVAHLTCIGEDIMTSILSKSVSNTHTWCCVPDPPPVLHEVCRRFRDIFRKDVIWKLICERLGIVKEEDHPKDTSYKFAYSTFLLRTLTTNNICPHENEFGKAYRTHMLRIKHAGCVTEYGRLLEHVIQISSLTSLDLTDCKHINNLPESISRLQNLKELNLNGCVHITDLPASIGDLKSLEVLRMHSRHYAKSLPAQLGNLKRLRILQMSCWTCLNVLPSCVCKLSTLTQLDVNFCHELAKLPKSMARMKSLTSLAMINVGLRKSKEQLEIIKSIDSLVLINYRAVAKFFKAVELINC